MKYKGILSLALLVLLSTFLFGCGKSAAIQAHESTSEEDSYQVNELTQKSIQLVVTQDSGSEVLYENILSFEDGETLCDVMQNTEELSAKWKGSFTHEIMGIKKDNGGIGGERKAWFFHVNGLCSDACAPGVGLNDGDVIWYDYHTWVSMSSANSAIVGSYPEPFVHGFRGEVNPSIIMASESHMEMAEALKESMLEIGVLDVEIKGFDVSLIRDRIGPTIVLGEWDEIKGFDYIQALNKSYKKTGLNVRFMEEGIELHRFDGEHVRTVSENGGIIVATGTGAGDRNALWLAVGTDLEGLEAVAELLTEEPEKIKNMYGAAIVSGEVIRLPIQ